MGKEIKPIAFYLPQYHSIPENDKWWGEGFTEWTNVKRAVPLWKGHYQPKEPLNDNYYCLLDKTVLEQQSELAMKYGVYGFCYYHYWFGNGKKLLEKPVEDMLENAAVKIPFCLCWANENWTRNWDGGNREVMVEQSYGDEKTWDKHLQYLIKFFKDNRYIKHNNAPVFIIYKPYLIPNFNEMILYWQKNIKKFGFDKIIIMSQFPESFLHDENDSAIDYKIKFEPLYANQKLNFFIKAYFTIYSFIKSKYNTHIRSYNSTWMYIINSKHKGGNIIPGAFVDWDNTARNKKGTVFVGASPKKFGKYIFKMFEQILNNEYKTEFIFINAWNEWGEGAYLEPDNKNGYGYLEALKNSLDNFKK